jgi:LPS sulfotransferase NodH
MDEAARGFAICCEPRSGSTLLARILSSTGLLGRAWEVFRDPAAVREIGADATALDRLVATASTPNGVYGLKIFSRQFETAEAIGWTQRLPNLSFVSLERRDLLGQAVSLSRALQTGQYKAAEPATGAPRYDRRLIADCLARIAYGRARWHCYFARNGLQPLTLVYEEVVRDPQASAHAVAAHIGLAAVPKVDLGGLDLVVQRDAETEEARRRFVREAGDLSYLDGGFLFSRRRGGGRLARFFLGPARTAKGSAAG